MQPKPIEQILEQTPGWMTASHGAQTSEQKDALIHTKTKCIDNMAFQIRTLTNAILGFSELLLNEDLNETQREYIQEIFGAGQGMVSLVNDVLDMTRLEKGELQVRREDCSLAWLLEEIDAKVRPAAQEKGLVFEIISGAEVPANIRTDAQRLRQCLMILAGNAIKFTRKGQVRIEVNLLRHREQAYIRFDIIDTGKGIPEDKQSTIFQPYSRFEAGQRKHVDQPGTGPDGQQRPGGDGATGPVAAGADRHDQRDRTRIDLFAGDSDGRGGPGPDHPGGGDERSLECVTGRAGFVGVASAVLRACAGRG